MKKTIQKSIEAPIAIITIAKIAAFVFSKNGLEIPEDLIYESTIALYGTFKGFQNWIKNRKK